MHPLVYQLCHKPLLSAALATASLCQFPPLVKDVPLQLAEAGAIASADVDVTVGLEYRVLLELRHPDGESLSRQEVGILGDRRVEQCSDPAELARLAARERPSLGRPMAFRVEVRRRDNGALVHASDVTTQCVASKWANQRSRSLGMVALAEGQYALKVENLQAQRGLERLSATLVVAAEGLKRLRGGASRPSGHCPPTPRLRGPCAGGHSGLR